MKANIKLQPTAKMIDLHTHSTASDGTLSPREIVLKAVNIGLSAIALTDHDTINGLDEFLQCAKDLPISAVPGVEIAGAWESREIHILGFWIDCNNEKMGALLENSRNNRETRNTAIIEKLNNKGFQFTQEELDSESEGEVIGRPHIASLLVKKKYFKSAQDVFSSCLARGSECYTPRMLPDIKEVMEAIHSAGGIAIWAHPLHRNKNDISNIRAEILSLMGFGLDGVEAYYPQYTQKQHKALLKCAEEFNLAISGGTDFHGENQPTISMAIGRGELNIPDSVYVNLRNYREEKYKVN